MTTTAIWWIRRDLRLTDNQALATALQHAERIIPLFVLDPIAHRASNVSPRRLAFLYDALRALDADLRQRGSRLIIRSGSPQEVIPAVTAELRARIVVAEEDYSPYARRRDRLVAQRAPLLLTPGIVIHRPDDLLSSSNRPYTVFTHFARVWRARPLPSPRDLLPAPSRLPAVPEEIPSLAIPQHTGFTWATVPPHERAAQERLRAFCSGEAAPIFHYQAERNWLDGRGSSHLSVYFRFGLLSVRQAILAAAQARAQATNAAERASVDAWINELIWREFYINVLAHFPNVLSQSFRPEYDAVEWNHDEAHFAAWQEGMTGYPVVDAAMRQLRREGWISNRARMLVASFLTKDLLIHWRWGERWFWKELLDGDPAANNGGWQWVAGTGTDAAPFIRIFNPVKQGEQFDPDGRYVRQWIPELEGCPDAFLHHPWDMPITLQMQTGCRIGRTYPAPLVDHQRARQRALTLLARIRQQRADSG